MADSILNHNSTNAPGYVEPDSTPDPEHMVLRTEKLVKIYGKRKVVDGPSIQVRQGEIVGLLGPNGAGKTTTFYMTVGLIEPNEGHVYLNDEDITKFPVYRRAQCGVGYLAQEASVFRTLSVEDNIMGVLEMTNFPKDYQRQRLEELISEFGLGHIRKSLGIQLSGGERRRTEIARCLAINPKFVMLDEPFAGVDPIAVYDIQKIVSHLKDKNIGVLISDHNVGETLAICDRAYIRSVDVFSVPVLPSNSPLMHASARSISARTLSSVAAVSMTRVGWGIPLLHSPFLSRLPWREFFCAYCTIYPCLSRYPVVYLVQHL